MSGFHLCSPRNKIVVSKIELKCSVSQFLHTYICERFIYFQDRSAYSAAGKYVDRFWEYINRSETHECAEIGTEAAKFQEKEYINGIFVTVYRRGRGGVMASEFWRPQPCILGRMGGISSLRGFYTAISQRVGSTEKPKARESAPISVLSMLTGGRGVVASEFWRRPPALHTWQNGWNKQPKGYLSHN
jgi:hypothetical protein